MNNKKFDRLPRWTWVLATLSVSAWASANVTGTVVDDQGRPVAGARVRISMGGSPPPTSKDFAVSDELGRFDVGPKPPGSAVLSVGGKDYVTMDGAVDSNGPFEVPIEPLFAADNPGYQWIPPDTNQPQQQIACNTCHTRQTEQWKNSWHAKAGTNPIVLDLYDGSGAGGAPGASWRGDNPDDAGPCANCHAAVAAMDNPGQTVLSEVSGVAKRGVFCETCHKVRDVADPSKPGVGGALQIWRPPFAFQFAFGPYDDAKTHSMITSYNPLFRSARLCSGCHEWKMQLPGGGEVPIMTTFSEWSPAGDPADAQQCQDCHMRAFYRDEPDSMFCQNMNESSSEPNRCIVGIENMANIQVMSARRRFPEVVSRHRFEGASEEYLKKTFETEVDITQAEGTIRVAVTLRNQFAGHAVPTGMPFREVLLVVDGTDPDGKALKQVEGPTLEASAGNYAEHPGVRFARVLGDAEGTPDVPFWRATQELSDNRLRPGESATFTFVFEGSDVGDENSVEMRLWHRRLSATLATQKDWDTKDTQMDVQKFGVKIAARGSCRALPAPTGLGAAWLIVLALGRRRRF